MFAVQMSFFSYLSLLHKYLPPSSPPQMPQILENPATQLRDKYSSAYLYNLFVYHYVKIFWQKYFNASSNISQRNPVGSSFHFTQIVLYLNLPPESFLTFAATPVEKAVFIPLILPWWISPWAREMEILHQVIQ